jgi:hypothetical protein
MAQTTAERQRAFRRRQVERIAALEHENARFRADLTDVLAEAERLAAQQCRHPAAAVDGGHCHACGNDKW